jgi:hypothetical protein
MSEKKIVARIAAGYGSGEGWSYRPFLEITDFPSLGRCRMFRNPLLNRYHHLFSDLEWYHFLYRFKEKGAIDWREQFPLDRRITRLIAIALGYKHPRDRNSDADGIVMTTDLLVTYDGPNGKYLVAYSVKYASDKNKKRVKEKHEIEEMYWKERGVKFFVVTEEDLPYGVSSTGKFLLSYYSLAGLAEPSMEEAKVLADRIIRTLPKASPDQVFTHFMQKLDVRVDAELGTHLTVGLHLLSRGILVTDLDVDEIQFTPLGDVSIATNDFEII